MRRHLLGTTLAAAAVLASAAAANAQVGFNSFPIYSNGYVVSVPLSAAGPASVVYPGGVGGRTYPSANTTVSGNTLVDSGPGLYRTFYYPTNSPRNNAYPVSAAGTTQSTFNPVVGTGTNPYNPLNFLTNTGVGAPLTSPAARLPELPGYDLFRR